jgi:phosphohistidine phosphatase
MTIFLIRHADAVSEEEDRTRPLSAKGRDQVALVSSALKAYGGFQPAEIWHSPLLRSRETAALLRRGLGLSAPLTLKVGLEPDDNPETIALVLNGETQDVAVVGHEPHLGVLAAQMVEGPSNPPFFYPFPKAGVLALVRKGKRWKSEWLIR